MKAEKWVLLGVGIFVVLMICAGIVGYNEQREVQEQVNVVEDTFDRIDEHRLGSGTITVYHDDKRNVTCWIWKIVESGGISCIPDHMLSP